MNNKSNGSMNKTSHGSSPSNGSQNNMNQANSKHQRGNSSSGAKTHPASERASSSTPLGANLGPALKKTVDRLQHTSLESVWWAAHAFFFLHALLYLLGLGYQVDPRSWSKSWISFLARGIFAPLTLEGIYRRGIWSLLLAYAIVVFKSYKAGAKRSAQAWLLDQNALYTALAFWMTFSVPMSLLYYTLAIYSFYHVITWPQVQSNLPSVLHSVLRPILAHQSTVVMFGAHLEWLAWFTLLFSVISGWSSLFTLLFYTTFLRLQYAASPRARLSLNQWNKQLEHWTKHPSCPPVLRQGYESICNYLAKFAPPIATAAPHST